MGYRIIPASLAIGLTTNEAYTYFCLLAKSDYNTYISHVKQDRIYIQAYRETNKERVTTERYTTEHWQQRCVQYLYVLSIQTTN